MQFGPPRSRHQDRIRYRRDSQEMPEKERESFQTVALVRYLCRERRREGLDRENLRSQSSSGKKTLAMSICRTGPGLLSLLGPLISWKWNRGSVSCVNLKVYPKVRQLEVASHLCCPQQILLKWDLSGSIPWLPHKDNIKYNECSNKGGTKLYLYWSYDCIQAQV